MHSDDRRKLLCVRCPCRVRQTCTRSSSADMTTSVCATQLVGEMTSLSAGRPVGKLACRRVDRIPWRAVKVFGRAVLITACQHGPYSRIALIQLCADVDGNYIEKVSWKLETAHGRPVIRTCCIDSAEIGWIRANGKEKSTGVFSVNECMDWNKSPWKIFKKYSLENVHFKAFSRNELNVKLFIIWFCCILTAAKNGKNINDYHYSSQQFVSRAI